MDNAQCALMKKICEMEFVAIELQLYLDTHPCDSDALNDYNCAVDVLRKYQLKYEDEFGSIMEIGHHGVNGKWDWVNSPWPWQM
ncbi:spore coat protein JB [Sporomusaceae bacterium BoRhaA]|uniref:spore coat protein CotJB n=1 Tax=Pelorhabdus rhamnosifermentans TaxID=2772457 RepID=UPI001C060E22|nr:spore coat protein CotJB [Pelorhabdus rhamnosifermentans]MBU2700814.1 spore coat protein JB [Pelorhabdus rhamnosifermentans]